MKMDWDAYHRLEKAHRWWPAEALVSAVCGRRQRLGRNLGYVLEVGCGCGGNTWFLAEQADRVIACDTSHTALGSAQSYMRNRAVDDVAFERCDIRNMDFPQNAFDAIVDVQVSQHLSWDDHRKVYDDYWRLLRPGGWLFLVHMDDRTDVPGETQGRLRRLGMFEDAGEICFPTTAELSQLVQSVGFPMANINRLVREYDNGANVSYTVLDAEAAK